MVIHLQAPKFPYPCIHTHHFRGGFILLMKRRPPMVTAYQATTLRFIYPRPSGYVLQLLVNLYHDLNGCCSH